MLRLFLLLINSRILGLAKHGLIVDYQEQSDNIIG